MEPAQDYRDDLPEVQKQAVEQAEEDAMKKCKTCGAEKELSEFYFRPNRNLRDDHDPNCKDCMNKKKRMLYSDNKEKQYAANRKWVKENRERVRKNSRAWYASHPEHYAEYVKKQRRDNPQMALAYATVENAIRSGKIMRPELCGSCKNPGLIQAHHKDYSKPLDVEWLCVKCHNAVHHSIAA